MKAQLRRSVPVSVEEGSFLRHLITKQEIRANPSKTNSPIKQTLTKPEKSGRVAKWAIKQGEHDIVFQKRDDEMPKDFLIEVPLEDNKKEAEEKADTKPTKTKLSCEWKLFTNGAASPDGSGAGLTLIDPKGKEYTYALRFRFETTNNKAEYEALLAGAGRSPTKAINRRERDPVASPQTDDIVKEVHEGSCGFNAEPRSIVVRITKQGYYWPSMNRDAAKVLQDYEKCKEQSAIRKVAESNAITVRSGWPFSHWGVNILGPLATTPRGFKFLAIAVEHSTKWVEAKPVTPPNRVPSDLASRGVTHASASLTRARLTVSSYIKYVALHGAVSSAITQVAVTAVAIASGACLSTKLDFLSPPKPPPPSQAIIDGVDVTGYPVFNHPKVHKAIAFARNAHSGQLRKTGDPYLTHCINTAKILALLVPSTVGQKAIDTVVSGILHDVVDDTSQSLSTIELEFGQDIAKLVADTAGLMSISLPLAMKRRINIRVMLIGMVDDPRVVHIKRADRQHNIDHVGSVSVFLIIHIISYYALPSAKAKAVAQETLVIWCSLASRLGLWALKAELEDLCFAVLQMRSDLAAMSTTRTRVDNPRRLSSKSSTSNAEPNRRNVTPECEASLDDVEVSMKVVLPFDLLLDRRKRIQYIQDLGSCSEVQTKPKVVRDAGIALASLVVCEEELERELFISTSYVPGMEVTLSSRLKSLYSIYSKMNRKEVSIDKVYDARALRVIVGDRSGTLHGQAVQCCYNLLSIIHRLWTPIDGEFDDYIVNPKPSGYQAKAATLVAAHKMEHIIVQQQRLLLQWLHKNRKAENTTAVGSELR
ncbi:beta-grasp domain-containing protein [Tanacetum coccineum]|uniref:Beta-grasp domain-containing protein n=1 Tax=Tanacetum coccineum TaxID=301880 RepID=A0ABQ5CWU0_9ASTR